MEAQRFVMLPQYDLKHQHPKLAISPHPPPPTDGLQVSSPHKEQ